MPLQQTLQASTKKSTELFDSLQNTSNQAVKTREGLVAELGRELRLYTDLEERHLFPALRSNENTKGLFPDAVTANKDLLAKIEPLEALPKGDAQFLPQLSEFRKAFERHVRDERKLLSVLQDRLSQEKVDAVASKIEAGFAEAEAEQDAENSERKLEAKREREHEKHVAERKQAVSDAVDSAKQNVRDLGHAAAEGVHRGVTSVKEATHDAGEGAAKAADRVKDRASETMTAFRETARERGQDIKAVGAALAALGQARSDLGSLIKDAFKRSGSNGLETTKRILRKPSEMGQVQRDFAAAATHNLMVTTQVLLQIVRRAAAAAVKPVEKRLEAVS